jgi:hypothetical protein
VSLTEGPAAGPRRSNTFPVEGVVIIEVGGGTVLIIEVGGGTVVIIEEGVVIIAVGGGTVVIIEEGGGAVLMAFRAAEARSKAKAAFSRTDAFNSMAAAACFIALKASADVKSRASSFALAHPPSRAFSSSSKLRFCNIQIKKKIENV